MALKLLYEHAMTEEAAVKFLQDRGVLRSQAPECATCGKVTTFMTLENGGLWRCPTHESFTVSLTDSSYLDKSDLPLRNIIEILFFWAFKMTDQKAAAFIDLPEKDVTLWHQRCRDICSHWLESNPYKIGGPGIVVEVDDCLGNKEFAFDYDLEKRMVFGAVCPLTGHGFLEIVPDKMSDTILSLIELRIAPGSIIMTNKSEVYEGVTALPVEPPFIHGFLKKESRPSQIKLYWRKCKRRLDDMCSVHPLTLKSYLDEFMWRALHGRTGTDAFDNILKHLSVWYSFDPYVSV